MLERQGSEDAGAGARERQGDVETAMPAPTSPTSPRLQATETFTLLKNAAFPPGGMEQLGEQFVERHSFVLWKIFERRRSKQESDGSEPKPSSLASSSSSWWLYAKENVKGYARGFGKDHWILFLQTFVAYVAVLAIISPDAVYTALSYGGSFQPVWGIIYLLMMCMLGGTVGMSTLLQMYVFVSLVFAGCFGLWVRHMTYLAAGSDWTNNDVAKGATYTVLMSVSCGAFNILRWRWDVTNPLFYLCSIFLIFTQGAYSGPGAGTLYLQPVYSLINISIATVMFTVVSWVLMPLYSATKMRMGTAKALQSLGKALLAERDLILGPVDAETGLLENASGKVDVITGRDTGLFDQCDVIGTHINTARGLILGNRPLRVPCLLEVDLYKRHGGLTFPVLSFMHVEYYSHTLLSIITNLARPVKMGNTNMRKLQRPDLRLALDGLFRSFDAVLGGLAASITEDVKDGNRQSWKLVDDLMEASHDSWLEFLRAGQRAIAASDCVDENFGVKIVSIFLYSVGSRIRELYFSVAIAVSQEEPLALDLAFVRAEKRPAWMLSRTAYEHVDMDPLQIIDIQMMGLLSTEGKDDGNGGDGGDGGDGGSSHDGTWMAKTKKAIRQAQHEKNLTAVLASEFGLAQKSANLRPGKAFRVPLWVIMGLQYVVTISIALILTVIPAVNREVFNNRGNDVLFTVVVMWQPNIGSINSRAFNRALGTFMGAIWSYLLLGITYGATGTTWSDSPQKWIVSGFLGAIWGSFCMLNAARYRTYSYMWFVAGFTVALVTLSLLRLPTPPWADAAERLLNVIYGIIISWLVAVILFPISAWRMVTDNYANSCSAMRDAVLALADLFESTDSPHGAENEIIIAPKDTLYQNEIGISAMYRPFEQRNLARAMSLSNRARRITSSTAAFIKPAENESMILRRPRMIPRGHLTRSIHASNIFIDYIIQVLSVKMEFFPQANWKVKPDMYEAISSSFAGIAKVLDLMEGIIHLPKKPRGTSTSSSSTSIDDMIDALDVAAGSIERLTVLSRDTLESCSHRSTGAHDSRAPLQNDEILVVYLCLNMFMQAKAILLAASKSFLFTNPEAQQKIEDAVNRRDFLSQLKRGPESIIMHLLEISALLNARANASKRRVRDPSASVHAASTMSEDVASELKEALDELTLTLSRASSAKSSVEID